jgi:hypothetical protein
MTKGKRSTTMSNQRVVTPSAAALLQEAQIAIGETTEMQSGSIHELDSSQCRGRRALVFDRKDGGFTIAVRVELPATNTVRGKPVTSSEALELLGGLTLTLQQHDAEAKLMEGGNGVEAVMLSSRVCERNVDAASLNDRLNRLQDIAASVESAIGAPAADVIGRLFEEVRPSVAAPTKEPVRVPPIVVPTFDEEARNRMMQQLRQ